MEIETEKRCLICHEEAGDFLTRCNHLYHLACLSTWFNIRNEECPLCRGPISKDLLLEDVIAKRGTSASLFKLDSLDLIDKRVIGWALKYQNRIVLADILEKGLDLVIPATEQKQLDNLQEFLKKELTCTTGDSISTSTYLKNINEHIKIVEYVLEEVKFESFYCSMGRAGRENRLDILQYFVEKNTPYIWLRVAAEEAALSGHFELVKYLIKNTESSITETLVKNAVKGGHLEILKYLDREFELTSTSSHYYEHYEQRFLIEEAVASGHVAIVEYFFSKRITCPNGIRIAVKNGRFEMVKYLVEIGQSFTEYEIYIAAEIGCLDIVKYLINREGGKGTCHLDMVDNAATYGRTEVVKYLVQIGKPYSDRAFNFGLRVANLEIVKCLIENGHPYTSHALNYSAERGHLDLVRYLVERGSPGTSNAIDNAAKGGHLEIIKCLIENGYPYSHVAMENAALHSNLEVVKYFAEMRVRWTEKATVNAISNHSVSLEMVKYMYESGAPCDENAIDRAAEGRNFEIVKYLIEKGQHFTFTALEAAVKYQNLEMIEYLVENKNLLICKKG